MAGQSKTGSNFVVAFSLPKSQNPEADGYILVNAPSVRDFNMSFGLNGMPSGHAKCLLNHTSDVPVSGVYGSMIIQDLGTEQKDDRAYGIYISNLVQGQNTTDSISIEFDFMIGSQAADLKQKNFACTGTSSTAMKECAKYAGMDYLSRYSDNGKNTDTMVWRLVNGNFEENMNYIVANSYVPSDVLFWVFDVWQDCHLDIQYGKGLQDSLPHAFLAGCTCIYNGCRIQANWIGGDYCLPLSVNGAC